jgi:hypothetical protein
MQKAAAVAALALAYNTLFQILIIFALIPLLIMVLK